MNSEVLKQELSKMEAQLKFIHKMAKEGKFNDKFTKEEVLYLTKKSLKYAIEIGDLKSVLYDDIDLQIFPKGD